MATQALSGAGYFIQGLRLLTRPGLRRYVFIPLTINILLFTLLLTLAAGGFGTFIDGLMPQLPDWLAWLAWLLWLLFAVTALVLVFFTFSILANLVGAPFNGLLAEAVERQLTGAEPPPGDSLWKALLDTPSALLDELRKLRYFLLWALPLLILFWIPVVNLAAPFLWTLFSAWMLALEYGDYPMGNHGLRFADQRPRWRGRPLLGLGFGGATLLATLIPLFNFLVMPAAVAGATALWVKELRQAADRAGE